MPLISKSEFARLAGVSAMTITKNVSRGKKVLAPAVVSKKIDPDHPAAVAYLKAQRGEPQIPEEIAAPAPKPQRKATTKKHPKAPKELYESIQDALDEIQDMESEADQFNAMQAFVHKRHVRLLPTDVRKIADKPLNKLVEIFGTDIDFVKWLDSTKKLEDIAALKIKNAKAIGEVVSKDIVKKGILAPIDGLHRKLLTDGAKTIEKELRTLFELEKPPEECEVALQQIISGFIRPMKDQIRRGVKNLEVD
jgi:hypothetical protein